MTTGTVKFYNAVKGYELITPAAGRNTIFVHEAMVLGSGLERLSEGQKIEFNVKSGRIPLGTHPATGAPINFTSKIKYADDLRVCP